MAREFFARASKTTGFNDDNCIETGKNFVKSKTRLFFLR